MAEKAPAAQAKQAASPAAAAKPAAVVDEEDEEDDEEEEARPLPRTYVCSAAHGGDGCLILGPSPAAAGGCARPGGRPPPPHGRHRFALAQRDPRCRGCL